ncbi:MAG TPA: tRNA epoxyqueuosine(34) reductase QueG [Gemmatimonadota bacterium]|nr:tRNA epoxyqueuosine(34) reductase QueG [Gemmatimonadota bacterium]
MHSAELTRRIKVEARKLGFDLVGVARAEAVTEAPFVSEWLGRGYHGTMDWMANHFVKRTDPRALVPGCRSIVCVALLYHRPDTDAPRPDGAEVATYAWGEDYHRVLKDKLHILLERGRALDPSFEGRAFTDSAPVMDRYWAERAGLGWRGKNTNLLNTRLGSFFFLGELLVRAELAPDEPGTDHCGSCTRCLEACPTGALVEPYVLDARRCISYWTIEHREGLAPEQEDAVGAWLFGCDICQDVCPWNRSAPESSEPRFESRPERWPTSLDDLLALGENAFERLFGDTAVERVRRRGLVRNAAIVAGNTGRGSDAALGRAAEDPDPVVAAAARRALAKRRNGDAS